VTFHPINDHHFDFFDHAMASTTTRHGTDVLTTSTSVPANSPTTGSTPCLSLPSPAAGSATATSPTASPRPAQQSGIQANSQGNATEPGGEFEIWKIRIHKKLNPTAALGLLVATLGLIWTVKSFSESARANILALQESCRSHPVSSQAFRTKFGCR
jgi:hypothetical protein